MGIILNTIRWNKKLEEILALYILHSFLGQGSSLHSRLEKAFLHKPIEKKEVQFMISRIWDQLIHFLNLG
jgi:hypothetical protein